MKKLNTRTIFLSLLIAASMCSYIYLNTISDSEISVAGMKDLQVKQEMPELDENALEQKEVSLPGVTILKGVLQMGKSILPANP